MITVEHKLKLTLCFISLLKILSGGGTEGCTTGMYSGPLDTGRCGNQPIRKSSTFFLKNFPPDLSQPPGNRWYEMRTPGHQMCYLTLITVSLFFFFHKV